MKINQQTLIMGGLASVAATLFVTRPQLFNSLFPGSAVASQPNQSMPTQPIQPSTPVDPSLGARSLAPYKGAGSHRCEDYLNRQPEQIPGSFYGGY